MIMKSTMTMAVLLVLALFGTFSVASASDCEDNPDFRYKKDEKKTCGWVGSLSKKKKKKICKKKGVEKNCKSTCDVCDVGLMHCPFKFTSRNFKKNCNSFETGLECGYKHVYTGCNTGEMACTPTKIYTCLDDSSESDSSKSWILSDADDEDCEIFDPPRPYGDKCDPHQCPPFEPSEGDDCEWYHSKDKTCGYDPKWYGCSYGELQCANSREFTCDPLDLVWTMNEKTPPSCSLGGHQGESCDIDNPIQPVRPPVDGGDRQLSCPEEEPTTDRCEDGRTPDGGCGYNYVVTGCTTDEISCSAMATYECYYDDAPWLKSTGGAELCSDDDIPFGESCDPENFDPSIYDPDDGLDGDDETSEDNRDDEGDGGDGRPETRPPQGFTDCPAIVPTHGDDCDSEGASYSPEGCAYGYFIYGCNFSDLSCVPGSLATCQMNSLPVIREDGNGGLTIQTDMTWDVATMGIEFCLDSPDDWPDGEACDPESFDKLIYLDLIDGSDDEDERGDDGCPDEVPDAFAICDGPKTCRYGYNIYGCTRLELTCSASTWADCEPANIPVRDPEPGEISTEPGFRWAVAMESRLPCVDTPDDWPEGEACDPEDFDPWEAAPIQLRQ